LRKLLIALLVMSFLFLSIACTSPMQDDTTTDEVTEQTISTEIFTWPDLDWPERDYYLEHSGIEGVENVIGRFRFHFYHLPYQFTSLVGIESYLVWARSRSNDQYHNEHIAVSFIRDFDISREDFKRANEEWRTQAEDDDRAPEQHSQNAAYPINLIFSFDNERINEFFRWENSIYAHEVGLPNPLRGDWDEDGVWHDHPNWTENPGWREHPFWDYLPFNPANMPEGSIQ